MPKNTEKRKHIAHFTVSQKNVPPMACYNFDRHEWILIFFWQQCYR